MASCYNASVTDWERRRPIGHVPLASGGMMPRRPKHPCAYPGCPELTEKRYCEVHTKVMNKRYETQKRNPETSKRYKGSWHKIREAYKASHPYCEICYKRWVEAGCPPNLIPPLTEHVHHILPLSEGGTHAMSNLQSLCKSCHSRIHAQRGDMWHDR